jgi:hypothetical protein
MGNKFSKDSHLKDGFASTKFKTPELGLSG